jgi:hypothetical protein
LVEPSLAESTTGSGLGGHVRTVHTLKIWPDGAASYGQDDGFPIDDPAEFAELARGEFLLRGVSFTAEKVNAQAEPAIWHEHYEFREEIARRGYQFKDAR